MADAPSADAAAGRERPAPHRGRRVTASRTGLAAAGSAGPAPEGIDPRLVRRFIELAGGPRAPPRRRARPPARRRRRPSRRYRESFELEGVRRPRGARHPRARQDADAPEALAQLRDATGVMFTGGDQLRLLEIFSGARVHGRPAAPHPRGHSSSAAPAPAPWRIGDPAIVRGEPDRVLRGRRRSGTRPASASSRASAWTRTSWCAAAWPRLVAMVGRLPGHRRPRHRGGLRASRSRPTASPP